VFLLKPSEFDDRLRSNLARAGVPPRIVDRASRPLGTNPPDPTAYESLSAVAESAFRNPEAIPLLVMLTGDIGTGKTVMGTRLFGYFAHAQFIAGGEWPNVRWETGYRLTSAVKYSTGSEYLSCWNLYARPDLLLVDDVFTEKTTVTDVHLIAELIEERKNHYRRTIITTNKTVKDFENLSPRLSERLLEDAEIIVFTGSSRRLASLR